MELTDIEYEKMHNIIIRLYKYYFNHGNTDNLNQINQINDINKIMVELEVLTNVYF